ncbi:hypothetical protein [Manganibacter manganicus]|uniref:Uncharacterized protein n=1 Tax=Manganibacter manganicus TaxID=1873176 RepID=A0A1V8RJ54_9HYPH|nr:hypothetical protein [Pseudaminobacter manganicus]OQM73235.1 hypothetical protein BFN67_09580 [Pseudaminobacter manganicus]
MAGLEGRQSAVAHRQAEAGQEQAATGPAVPDCPSPTADYRLLLPRHLYRAVLRLLRPAEAAARRLVIIAARGLVVTPAKPRKPQPKAGHAAGAGQAGTEPSPKPRSLCLPLLDPLPAWNSRRRPAPAGVPRISVPGFSRPFPIALRRPSSPDDAVDARRLALRLDALGRALDNLPAQARRFARWQASRNAARAVQISHRASPARRIWPLRPGRPPGGSRRDGHKVSGHEVHEILKDVHGLAFWTLEESADTS